MAIVDTLGIADELARDGVFSREQAERLARVSGRAATEALVTKADLETVTTAIRTEIALLRKDLEQTSADLRKAAEASTALLRRSQRSSAAQRIRSEAAGDGEGAGQVVRGNPVGAWHRRDRSDGDPGEAALTRPAGPTRDME